MNAFSLLHVGLDGLFEPTNVRFDTMIKAIGRLSPTTHNMVLETVLFSKGWDRPSSLQKNPLLTGSTQNLKTSEEDLQSSTEALVLPPSKPRSRRGSTVGLEPKESDGSTEALTLPDIDNFQRSSSRKSRKSFKKKKKGGDDNGDPYPKRKGSFRRYSLAPEAAL